MAALAVVYHLVGSELYQHYGLSKPLPLTLVGAAGVDLFFVISGFVMVYASERMFGQRHSPRIFALRRLARIVPLYWR